MDLPNGKRRPGFVGHAVAGVEMKLGAGDEILVLPEVPVKNLEIAKTIINSIFQIAVAAGVFLAL